MDVMRSELCKRTGKISHKISQHPNLRQLHEALEALGYVYSCNVYTLDTNDVRIQYQVG